MKKSIFEHKNDKMQATKSPFPGMNPYLEGHLFPDLHNGLSFTIKELLVPQVVPKYLVHTTIYTVKDTAPEEDIGIIYPDVEVMKNRNLVKEPIEIYQSKPNDIFTPASLTLSAILPVNVQIPVVEIRDKKNNELVTAIEILSPVNKRKPGLEKYREKRKELAESGVHLLELDLLRRGKRPFQYDSLAHCHYFVTLVRANQRKTDIWGMTIKDPFPIVPIPLKSPDSDIVLDLGKAFALLFERSAYGYSLDYSEKPPPPAFSEEEMIWMKKMTSK